MKKDLLVTKLQVNEYILRIKSLQLELDGAREELAATQDKLMSIFFASKAYNLSWMVLGRNLLQLDLLLSLRIKIIRSRSPKPGS